METDRPDDQEVPEEFRALGEKEGLSPEAIGNLWNGELQTLLFRRRDGFIKALRVRSADGHPIPEDVIEKLRNLVEEEGNFLAGTSENETFGNN